MLLFCCGSNGQRRCPAADDIQDSKNGAQHSCCRHDEQASGDTRVLHSTCCTRSLAQPDILSATSVRVLVAKEVTLEPFIPKPLLTVCLPAASRGISWRDHFLPPPSDLVIALLHVLV